MVGADAGLGLHTPKLNVPEDFKVRGLCCFMNVKDENLAS